MKKETSSDKNNKLSLVIKNLKCNFTKWQIGIFIINIIVLLVGVGLILKSQAGANIGNDGAIGVQGNMDSRRQEDEGAEKKRRKR